MYQKIRSMLYRTLIPFVLAAFMVPFTAFAQEPCSVSIPVTVSVSGSAPSGVPYRFVLEPVTAGTPVPEPAELTIINAGTGSFAPISYTVPGDYRYRVRQVWEDRDRFTFDDSVYDVVVRITNNEQTGGLASEVWAIKSGQEAKTGEITFANSYRSSSGGGGGGGGGSNTGNRAVPQGDGLTILDPETPLANMTPEEIPDLSVPLIGLPKTGDTTTLGLWLALAGISGSGCMLLILWNRRREAAEHRHF